MRQKFEKYTQLRPRLKKTAGWFLVVFGFIMLVTPLTPGGILFFVGLEILGLRTISQNSKIQKDAQVLETEMQKP